MQFDKTYLLAEFKGNPPADQDAIQRFEAEAGFLLPAEYKEFLAVANGGAGFMGEAYMHLWRVEELLTLNLAYQVAEYAPDLFVFGSNGGGEAFAFDRRLDPMPVVAVPFVGIESGLANRVGSSFGEFVSDSFRHDHGTKETPAESLRRCPVELFGKEIFEIHPVILGGNPTDPENKVVLDRQQRIEAVRYWNQVIRDLRNTSAD